MKSTTTTNFSPKTSLAAASGSIFYKEKLRLKIALIIFVISFSS